MCLNEKNNIMKTKIYLLLFCILVSMYLHSQNSEREAYHTYQQVENLAYDAISSFCGNPSIHENTIKVFNTLEKLRGPINEINSLYAPEGTQDLAKKYSELGYQIDCFIELLRDIRGYNSAGLEEEQMFFVTKCLKGMGWTERVVGVECDNAYFIEYQFEKFKMLFVKNTLPQRPMNDYSAPMNLIEVKFTYDYYGAGGTCNVGAGKYRMIQYMDNVCKDYYNLIKATSKKVN